MNLHAELFIDTNIWSFYWLYKNAVPKDSEMEKYVHQEIFTVLPKFYSLVNSNDLLSSYV